MKIRIENFTSLFLLVVILLAGCSGCAQKNAELPQDETPIPEVEISQSEKPDGVDTPTLANPTTQTNSEIEIIWKGKLQASLADPILSHLDVDERKRHILDDMLAANPDDYDTMLFWVIKANLGHEGESYETYKRKRIDVLRKLYVMNPDQPDVLFGLTEMLYDVYPQQAIEYAQSFIRLHPKHKFLRSMRLWLAASYLEAGELQESLALYKNVYNVSGDQVRPQDFLSNPRITQIDYMRIDRLGELLEGTEDERDKSKKVREKKHAATRKRLGLE